MRKRFFIPCRITTPPPFFFDPTYCSTSSGRGLFNTGYSKTWHVHWIVKLSGAVNPFIHPRRLSSMGQISIGVMRLMRRNCYKCMCTVEMRRIAPDSAGFWARACDAALIFSPSEVPANTKRLYNIIQRRPNVFDVGPTLYKCYTNVLCLLG